MEKSTKKIMVDLGHRILEYITSQSVNDKKSDKKSL